LIRKALSHKHKITKSNPPSALSRRWSDVVADPKALIARARTMVGTLMINLAMTTIGSRFSGDQTVIDPFSYRSD
jgi:hypothetical protein